MGAMGKKIKGRIEPKPTVKQMQDYAVEVSALAIQHERDLDAARLEYAKLEKQGKALKRFVWYLTVLLMLSLGANAYWAWEETRAPIHR